MPLFGNLKLLLLIIALLILVSIIIIVSLFSPQRTSGPQPSPQVPLSSVTPVLFPNIQPGKTTTDEIKNLTGIKSVEQLPGGLSQYIFSSPLINRDNIITTDSNQVVFKREVTVDENSKHPKVVDYKQQLGEPQETIQGSTHYGKFETFYIYADKGITLVANPFTEEIDEVHTYVPMTVAEYKQRWGNDIKEYPAEDHP